MEPQQRSIRKIKAVASLFIAFVAVLLAYLWFHNRTFNASVIADAVPSDTKVTFNGDRAHNGKNKVRDGVYSIVFTRNGFRAETRVVAVQKGKSQYVGVVLIPTDPKFANWYSEHPDDAKRAEGISSKNFDAIGENQVSASPFLKLLPFVQPTWRIDSGISQKYIDDPAKYAIYISFDTDADKQAALKWLEGQNVDITKLEVIYQKRNPAKKT